MNKGPARLSPLAIIFLIILAAAAYFFYAQYNRTLLLIYLDDISPTIDTLTTDLNSLTQDIRTAGATVQGYDRALTSLDKANNWLTYVKPPTRMAYPHSRMLDAIKVCTETGRDARDALAGSGRGVYYDRFAQAFVQKCDQAFLDAAYSLR